MSTAVGMLLLLGIGALATGNPVAAVMDAFYRGLWMLLPFTMQMALILVLSSTLGAARFSFAPRARRRRGSMSNLPFLLRHDVLRPGDLAVRALGERPAPDEYAGPFPRAADRSAAAVDHDLGAGHLRLHWGLPAGTPGRGAIPAPEPPSAALAVSRRGHAGRAAPRDRGSRADRPGRAARDPLGPGRAELGTGGDPRHRTGGLGLLSFSRQAPRAGSQLAQHHPVSAWRCSRTGTCPTSTGPFRPRSCRAGRLS